MKNGGKVSKKNYSLLRIIMHNLNYSNFISRKGKRVEGRKAGKRGDCIKKMNFLQVEMLFFSSAFQPLSISIRGNSWQNCVLINLSLKRIYRLFALRSGFSSWDPTVRSNLPKLIKWKIYVLNLYLTVIHHPVASSSGVGAWCVRAAFSARRWVPSPRLRILLSIMS